MCPLAAGKRNSRCHLNFNKKHKLPQTFILEDWIWYPCLTFLCFSLSPVFITSSPSSVLITMFFTRASRMLLFLPSQIILAWLHLFLLWYLHSLILFIHWKHSLSRIPLLPHFLEFTIFKLLAPASYPKCSWDN